MANQVKFYKGKYNPADHASLTGAIFFDTTSNNIYMDGKAYGMSAAQAKQLADLVGKIDNKVDQSTLTEDLKKKVDLAAYNAKVKDLEAADTALGVRIDGITASVTGNTLTIKDGKGKTTNFSVDLSSYAKTVDVNTKLDGKANTKHTHTIADVTNLQKELNAKATSANLDAEITRAKAAETKAKADAIADAEGKLATVKAALEKDIADLTGGGATKAELKKVQDQVNTIDAALKIITSEDTTAAIDSWNEVVNFLNEIETVSKSGEITGETLAAMLKGLDTRITANKSKHDSEYKTLNTTVTGHTSKISAVEKKANANASAIEKKQNILIAGDNITITGNKISSAIYWTDVQ